MPFLTVKGSPRVQPYVRQGWACPRRRLSASLTATNAIPTVMIPIASPELDPVKIITTPASISTAATTLKAQYEVYRVTTTPPFALDAMARPGPAHPGIHGGGLRTTTVFRDSTTPTMTVPHRRRPAGQVEREARSPRTSAGG